MAYFKLTFIPGTRHSPSWFGAMNDTTAFISQVKIKFWRDDTGEGWGICPDGLFAQYQAALIENSSAVQVDLATITAAVNPGLWS